MKSNIKPDNGFKSGFGKFFMCILNLRYFNARIVYSSVLVPK